MTPQATERDISLERHRAAIDRIDLALVRLLAMRQRRVTAIADLKTVAADVRNPGREAQILRRISAAARRLGLDEAMAILVWREIFRHSAAQQCARLEQRTADRRISSVGSTVPLEPYGQPS